MALWAAVAALVAGGGLLLAQGLAAGETSGAPLIASAWQIVGGTSYGAWWMLRESILAALVMTIRLRRNSQFSILNSAFCGSLILALVITQALQSHATAFSEFSLVRLLADALHVLAAGIWAGGVLALAVAIVPLLRRGDDEARLALTILRRFGALAAAALAALLVSGLFMSGQQVASLDALLTTLYGRALLIKLALAFGVALLGLRHAAILHPRLALALGSHRSGTKGEGHLPRTIPLEALGALALLLLAATLGATQPARGPAFDRPAETTAVPALTTKVDDLVITLAVKPNQPGRNFVGLGVFNTRRPAPASIDRVMIQLQAPGEVSAGALLAAEPLGGGRYQIAGGYLNVAGDWRITVVVGRSGMADTTAIFAWMVSAPVPASRPELISNRPLASILTPATIGCALVLGVVAVVYLGRQRITSLPAYVRSSLIARRPHTVRKE